MFPLKLTFRAGQHILRATTAMDKAVGWQMAPHKAY